MIGIITLVQGMKWGIFENLIVILLMALHPLHNLHDPSFLGTKIIGITMDLNFPKPILFP